MFDWRLSYKIKEGFDMNIEQLDIDKLDKDWVPVRDSVERSVGNSVWRAL